MVGGSVAYHPAKGSLMAGRDRVHGWLITINNPMLLVFFQDGHD
jgi:hypothetical protein